MMSPRRAGVCWGILVTLLLVLMGCSQPVTFPASTDGIAVATGVPPQITPEPTATEALPSGPYPPAIVDFHPRPGEAVSVSTTLSWEFDRPVDTQSFADALHLAPLVEGDLSWDGEARVTFTPQKLDPATRYLVTLSTDLVSAEGVPLPQPSSFAFRTLSPLLVTRVTPADGATGLRSDAPLRIEFSQPIVSTRCVDAEESDPGECLQLPLTFSPEASGRGSWEGTSVYRFDVAGGWKAGVRYEVTLGAALSSGGGAAMAAPHTWTFETVTPQISDVVPPAGDHNTAPDGDVRIRFTHADGSANHRRRLQPDI